MLKQTGEPQRFEGGAQRDNSENKPRPDLICPYFRMRFGRQLAKGAKYYGERNWEAGMPQSRFLESLHRHLAAYEKGETDEDHLAALAFNLQGLISQEERVALERLDESWMDRVNTSPFIWELENGES